MSETKTIPAEVRAAFEREPRIGIHRNLITLALRDGVLVLEGEVDALPAKRLAAEIAREIMGVRIDDRLRVAPLEPLGDGALRTAFAGALLKENSLRNCAVHVWANGRDEEVRTAPADACGTLHVLVEDGVVTVQGEVLSLSHRRLVELLAWWSPGCRNVVNELRVRPPEQDSDDEINDAVRFAIEKDHLIPSGQVSALTRERTVTLDGLVFRGAERERAQLDAWCISGVRDVIDRIEVRS
ncbi:MAG: BON domain-containing protein [Betaproteobacteria bacterium]|nr:BON domain-containing protein [Betaproteobacteria bacterium]